MPDLAAPLENETLMAYLVRTRPWFEWQDADGTAEPWAMHDYLGLVQAMVRIRPRLMSFEFDAWVKQLFPPPATALVAPVWPGADLVTLGDAVAIDRGVTIAGPLDGLLVSITAVDPKQMYYTYAGQRAYRHIGALAFISDSGQVENWQALGFTEAIYVPKTMSHAASAVLMTPGGTVGTVTPWTITSG